MYIHIMMFSKHTSVSSTSILDKNVVLHVLMLQSKTGLVGTYYRNPRSITISYYGSLATFTSVWYGFCSPWEFEDISLRLVFSNKLIEIIHYILTLAAHWMSHGCMLGIYSTCKKCVCQSWTLCTYLQTPPGPYWWWAHWGWSGCSYCWWVHLSAGVRPRAVFRWAWTHTAEVWGVLTSSNSWLYSSQDLQT